MKKIVSLLLFLSLIGFYSCEKEPGPGGKASIQGKILVQQNTSNCQGPVLEYYGIDEDIYLVFGDDPSYSERERTGHDGTYWFPNLRPGKYTVYALSENCDPLSDSLYSVIEEIEISDRKEEIIVPDLVVIRN